MPQVLPLAQVITSLSCLTAEDVAKLNQHSRCFKLLHSLRESVGRVPSSSGCGSADSSDFKRSYDRMRRFVNENSAGSGGEGGGGGNEDTGDEILEGVFESSDEESKDCGETHSSPLKVPNTCDE
ncbi:unnamed protein product, partial [Hydatigera taeniaeformis]|uniref:F-box domain-containing protein n=1 Tax=Hydatigena taeniaeformis TaxID=6205 RepID=A0A0R3WXG7_HYDTA